jgi:hypothetical protein
MNQAMLKSDGVLEIDGKPIASSPLSYLGYGLRLADTCTLRSYFRMLETYAPFNDLGDFFDVLRRQYAKCPENGCLWPDFSCLEFTKTVEMIGFPGKPRLEIYNSLHGVAGSATTEIRTLPLEVLVDVPLRMGRLKHVVFGDTVDTFEFETVYTLFEFIDSVAWELSFHGVPPECQIRS